MAFSVRSGLRAWLLAAGGVAALSAPAAAQDDGELRLGSGVDYSNGDYGETTDTTIITVPLSAAYVTRRWSVGATLPFVSVDGPGVIVPGGGAGPGATGPAGPLGLVNSLIYGAEPTAPTSPPGSPPLEVSESGLGDATLSASFAPIDTAKGLRLALSGGLRVPTGDADRALGTGETAGSLSAGLSRRFGRSAIYGLVGVERAFESEAEGLFGGVGTEGYVSGRTLLGASLSWSEATDDRLRDSAQASGYAGYDITETLQVRAYGSAGLTDTSPDFGAGLRFVIKQGGS